MSYAQSLINDGKFEEARSIAYNSIERDPENLRAYLLLIEITGLDGSKEDYDSKINDFVDKFGENEGLLEVMLKKTKHEETIYQSDIFLRMAQNYKETKSLEVRAQDNHNLAKRFLLSDRPYYALNQIKAAIKLNPNNSEIHMTKGIIHEAMDDLGEAAAEFLEAYRLSSMEEDDIYGGHISRILNRLAVQAMGGGLLEEALELLNLVTCHRYEFYINRGQCLQKMKEFEMAIEDYNEAIRLGGNEKVIPRLSLCHYELAVSHFRQRRLEKAEEHYTVAIEMDGRPEFYLGRSKCRIEQKKFELGIDDVVEAVDLTNYSQEDISHIKAALLGKYKGKGHNVCNRLFNHHK